MRSTQKAGLDRLILVEAESEDEGKVDDGPGAIRAEVGA